jgi:predicted negative regulator of RcsB-dependent stress response
LGKKKKIHVDIPRNEKKEIEKEVPIKEDVDLEFEFKVYLILDKLKKFKYFIIAGFVAIILAIIGWYMYEKNLEEKKNRASLMVYEISQLYENNKDKELMKKIEEFKKEYGDTDYIKLVLTYEYLVKKEKDKLKPSDTDNLLSKIKTENLKGYLKEFKAYLLFKEKKYKEALKILNTITQKDFNYISALTLKAIILKAENNPSYKEVLKQVKNLAKTPYFKQLADTLLSEKKIEVIP